MAQRSEVIIYAISTDDSGLVMRGDISFGANGKESDRRRAFFPFKMKDIRTHSLRSKMNCGSQYCGLLTNRGTLTPTGVTLDEIYTLKKDLQVRARKGYFAPQSSRCSRAFLIRFLSSQWQPNRFILTFPAKYLSQNARTAGVVRVCRRACSVFNVPLISVHPSDC